MSVFARSIREMLRLRPEQVGRCVVPCHVTPPLLSPGLIPHHFVVTAHTHTTHEPATSAGRQMAYNRVMVNTDTSILITNPNLNNFHIQMNSVFNTTSEWFMVNSLSLNLNKTFYGMRVFRMQMYIILIVMVCKRRESCRHLLIKLKILPLPPQYILSLLLFVINNRNHSTINSEIHGINSRHFNSFHQPRSNLSKYQN